MAQAVQVSEAQQRRVMKWFAIIVLVVGIIIGVAVSMATQSRDSSARADNYVALLQAAGIHGSSQDLISLGRRACADLNSGTPATQVLATVTTTGQLTGDFTPDQAFGLLGSATRAFCPAQTDAVLATQSPSS